MPARNFRRQIQLIIDDNLSPQARSKALAQYARTTRDELIQSGDASPYYTTSVDGRTGVSEDQVRGDGGGIINYHFSFLSTALQFALGFLRTRVTKVSGKLSDSFWVSIDDQFIAPGMTIDYTSIKPNSKIVIGNTESYWRKADVNLTGNRTLNYHNPNVLDDCVSALNSQFGKTILSAVRRSDYNFPGKYTPKLSPHRRKYNYQSPVVIIQEP